MIRYLSMAIAILLVGSFAKPAHADLILGGELFYTGGDVTVTLEGGEAAYHNFLSLYGDLGDAEDLLENHGDLGYSATITAAEMAALGYEAGDALMFGIGVFTGGSHDDPDGFTAIYLMGDGTDNPDLIMHAILDDGDAPDEYRVGFEDLYNGGDRDFNDTVFAFSDGVRGVPEPGTLLLLGMGLLGMSARRRMTAKA